MPSSIVTHAYWLKRRKKAQVAAVAAPAVVTASKFGARKSKPEDVRRSHRNSHEPALSW